MLIIDDDPVLRMLARAAIEGSDCDVLEADSGPSGLAVWEENRPDVVLLDVVMSGMDGYEVCRELRERGERHAVPILMMTSLDDVQSIERAYQAGATDFVTKPLNGTLLVHRLRYLMRVADQSREARDTSHRLAQAQRMARLVQWEFHPESGHFRWSSEADDVLGVRPAAESGGSAELLDWVHPDDRERVAAVLETLTPGVTEYRLLPDGGGERIIHQEVEIARDEAGLRYLVGAAQDVTERRRAEQRAARLAYYDSLTGLPNRAMLRRHLAKCCANARQQGTQVAVLAIDLDLFKRVNDLFGHAAGDALLSHAADTLRATIRADDPAFRAAPGQQESMAARLGGDEFVVVLPAADGSRVAARVAERLLRSLGAAFMFGQAEMSVTASIGIAVFPENGTDVEDLLQNADAALYHAKEQGRNTSEFFTAQMHDEAQRRNQIGNALHNLLGDDDDAARSALGSARLSREMSLHYQPKLTLGTRRIVGAEALIRWNSDDLGPLGPNEFIPVAEDTGLIIPLGEWVLREACMNLRQWSDRGQALPIAVNISARQFREAGFDELVARTVFEMGVDPRLLELEVTEGVVMQDIHRSVEVLGALRSLGVKVAIDDFGTGYSSLSYLTRFPIDTLKIDKSFIHLIGESGNDAVVSAIVALSRNLGLNIVAEGVERETQLDFLRRFGDIDIQGFLFAQPMSVPDLGSWIKRHELPARSRPLAS